MTRLFFAVSVLIAGSASAQGVSTYKSGQGASQVQGAAGTNGSVGDNGQQKCDKPMGAVAVVEPQDAIVASLTRYGLVVERGVGMQNLNQERQLASSGELRQGSNIGGGDIVSPRIANVKLLSAASDTAKAVGNLSNDDELVILGEEQNGFLNVQGSAGSGWVKKVLVTRH